EWRLGDQLKFEVTAEGPRGRVLVTSFVGVVVDPPAPPEPKEDEPRLVNSDLMAGTNRRPPYDLKYINRDDYETTPCWSETSWTDEDSGCFKDGYYKYLDDPSRWRLRKAIEQGLGSALRLGNRRLESFGRCVVLRTAQWALDGRANL